MRSPGVLWGFLALACAIAWGQPAPTPTDVDKAIGDLGDPSYQVRLRAQQALADVGWPAKPALEKAAKHPDPEIAENARKLLAELLPGVTGKTPENLRRLVRRYTEAKQTDEARNCMDEILGLDPVPHKLVLALLDWEPDAARRKSVATRVWERARHFLPMLLIQGESDVCGSYVAWATRLEQEGDAAEIAAFMYRRGTLGKLQQYAAARAKTEPSPFVRRLLVECLVLAGEEGEAVAAAKEMADWAYLEGVLVRLGRWQELAQEMVEREPAPNELRRLRMACAFRLAGQQELAAATLAKVMVHDDKGKGVPLVQAAGPTATAAMPLSILEQQGLDRNYVLPTKGDERSTLYVHGGNQQERKEAWYCLALMGFAGDAAQVLANEGNWRRAAMLLAGQGRYDEVDRVLAHAAAEAEPDARWEWVLHRAGKLREAGDDRGVMMVKQLLVECQNSKEEGTSAPAMKAMIQNVSWNGFGNLLPDRMPGLLAQAADMDEKTARELAWYWAPGMVEQQTWWDLLRKHHPDESVVALGTRLRDFLLGRLPDEQRDETLRLALHPGEATGEQVSGLVLLARTCVKQGHQHEAEEAYRLAKRLASEARDTKALGQVYGVSGDVFGPLANWSELAEAYRWLGENRRTELLGHAANLLDWMGDREGGQSLQEKAMLACPLSRLKQLLDPMEAGKWGDRGGRLLRMVLLGTGYLDSGATTAAMGEKDSKSALLAAQRIWYCAVPPTPMGYGPDGVLELNALLAYAESARLVDDGKMDEALAKANWATAMSPSRSWCPAGIRERLEKAGAKDVGDKLVADALALIQERLDRFPRAESLLNAFAWLAALTQLEVAKGETYIREAIERDPDEGYLVETLAVLLYEKGQKEEGIATMRECVRMAPTLRHLHRLGCWLKKEREKAAEGR